MKLLSIFLLLISSVFCVQAQKIEDMLHEIKLPEGFKIELYATEVENARSMAQGPEGVIFVGSRNEGKVYAVVDEDGDWKSDKTYVLAENLNMPNGVAYRDGDLFTTLQA